MVNDMRESHSNLQMSSQFEALRILAKQFCRVGTVLVLKTSQYLIERKPDSGFDSTKLDTHNPTKVGGRVLFTLSITLTNLKEVKQRQ